ncbi:MAG TPA: metalloregulator ArsR/SmtB family transcription factor [Solirubrobacteraceae bacterium]|nr:metalloregulator ArsR/SmtB family transcription factor [Solirubrobacteraceae bacterium]
MHGELLHIDEREGRRLRHARPQARAAERMAERYRALGDPTRLGLALALTGAGELCVCDLSWITQRPQNLVSHHMKVLRAAGIVSARREGKMTMYGLTAEGCELLAAAPRRS